MDKNSGMEFTNPNFTNKENPLKNPIIDVANEISSTIYADSLTGCYNRKYFDRFKEQFNPDRDPTQIGLVFVDLNDLKKTNDTYGHEAGDKLIKDAADFFKSSFRKEDTVIRLGGDEFVIICKNHQQDGNFEENLYKKVDENRILKSPVSFAFGVAVFDKSQDLTLDDTSHRADQLMYECKREMKSNKEI